MLLIVKYIIILCITKKEIKLLHNAYPLEFLFYTYWKSS